ncbi:hypothetical protein LPA06_08270 [Lacticaseibacillus paracasei subsp. tolerans]|nr:hypothetical protein LPA06_08270 [Lacticaseibacillus paracasei subsp. tolerans]
MLDISFGVGVDGGGRFIKNENGCLGCEGAGNAEELPLALRETASVFAEHGVVPVWQLVNEAFSICGFGGSFDFGVSGVWPTHANVFANGCGKKERFLLNNCDEPPQTSKGNLGDIVIIKGNAAAGEWV